MTSEYKKIMMCIGNYETMNFKNGFAHAKKTEATEIKFQWGDKMRTSDVEFINRLKKVWNTMTDTDSADYQFVAGEHCVFVSLADGTKLFS